MSLISRTFASTLFLASSLVLRPQTPPDPSGHWQGALHLPDHELNFAVDLAPSESGALAGTITIASEHLTGLPLAKVSVNGATVRFQARADQSFEGVLSSNGKSMKGRLSIEGESVPMDMTRTGDAVIPAPARIAPVTKDLEGNWEGVLKGKSTQLHVGLDISNQPDGSVRAGITNFDEGRLRIPVTSIAQTATHVTFEFAAVEASYEADLNADGTQLSGTYRQAKVVLPLSLRRARPAAAMSVK